LKIAVVVPGRFHAFHLACALLNQGHDVTVFTNYPKWAAKRFGLPPKQVRSFWLHGVLTRVIEQVSWKFIRKYIDKGFVLLFSYWAAYAVRKEKWDVIHAWSGYATEILKSKKNRSPLLLNRGSAHITTQTKLLKEEEKRMGLAVESASPWMIKRELYEYQYSDAIAVPSTFALNSFIENEVAISKTRLLLLGANTKSFYPTEEIVAERCRRLREKETLRILYVGAITAQKGIYDLIQIMKKLEKEIKNKRFLFHLIGPVEPLLSAYLKPVSDLFIFTPKVPEFELPQWYAKGDIFIFPTIQDGYAVVLAQAHANALPVMTTHHCIGPELIEENKSGWVFPIRRPCDFVEKLLWCDSHREELEKMVRYIYHNIQFRDWEKVAKEFVAISNEMTMSGSS